VDSGLNNRSKNKKDQKTKLFLICYFFWLGKWFLFQTFEELDSVKDKEAEVLQIHEIFHKS